MRALVVYESMYGNTAAVGEAIAASLRAQGFDAEGRLVSEIDPAETAEVDLLLVGGPTHVHGMSRASTRKAAASDEKNTFAATLEPGLREWLKRLPPGESRLAGAFDTRIDKPVILTGSAAKGIRRLLEAAGFQLVLNPECFLVSGENQLLAGELEHAEVWAEAIGSATARAGVLVATR